MIVRTPWSPSASGGLNDRVIPWYEQHDVDLLRILTDRGTEYCGNREHHEYQLYLAIEDIDHTKTKARSPQTNGICERLHKTMQDEFYSIAFRKKIYTSIEQLQADLDAWLVTYNEQRPHPPAADRCCYGKTPMATFKDSIPMAHAKRLDDSSLEGVRVSEVRPWRKSRAEDQGVTQGVIEARTKDTRSGSLAAVR